MVFRTVSGFYEASLNCHLFDLQGLTYGATAQDERHRNTRTAQYLMTKALITGGTGSFGKTMVQHLLARDYDEIRVFSRDEDKQDTMRRTLFDKRLRFYIGDIRDHSSLVAPMAGVDHVFHAAALKQVPSCEFFPHEAVLTNILGSGNVLKAAVNAGVKRVVCLSTDKAVQPINAMGISKAMMEKLVAAHARLNPDSETIVSCVRYGNVMESRGSVIPHFIRQIQSGQSITITNPEMTRFLLALPETVGLVDFAFGNARQGDIFIKRAPACTISDLAQALKNLFKANNAIALIGERHGEKLYETLATKEELQNSADMGDFVRIACDVRDLNYDAYFSEGMGDRANLTDYHSHNTIRLDVGQVENLLSGLPGVQAALAQRRE
jgi:UDP-N-acetylglucosamine 4,6-dehydratase/5-epimerase